jgi:two-component system sensor histidine kinase TctE
MDGQRRRTLTPTPGPLTWTSGKAAEPAPLLSDREAVAARPASVNPLRRPGKARSLFGEILDWMFAPLILVWPMSVSLTYLVAQSIAGAPFDQALTERAHALASYVHLEDGRPVLALPPGARDLLGLAKANGSSFALRDSRGTLLAGDAELPNPLEDEAAPPGEVRLRSDTLRGRDLRIAYASVQASASQSPLARVLVQVAEPTDERTHLANEIIKGVILPQFLVLPLALLLVWFGLSRGLAPLAHLQSRIQSRRQDDLSPIDPAPAPEELKPLVASFNELIGRMNRNLQAQRRFIADAAHQMKTPLAGLRTQAELALRQTDPGELRRSLRHIAQSSERATRLVNQLLALARAEHEAHGDQHFAPVDLTALARDVVREWVPQAIGRDLDLGFEAIEPQAPVSGSATLLQELIGNLVDNALRYTPAPGEITVRVTAHGQSVLLQVEDNGPGIAQADRGRVFDRFYRILGSGAEGSGLGLSIVREIAALHGAAVLIEDNPGGDPERPGCRVSVALARLSRAVTRNAGNSRP